MAITKLHRSQINKSGHLIKNSITTFTPRNNLKFIGATIVDDDVNDQTIISISGTGTGTTFHNELLDIQGGITDEYYHLTESQYTLLSNISDPLITDINSNSYIQNNSSFNFSYNDISNIKLFTLPANKKIYNIEINILTAFNGTTSTLAIGGSDDSHLISTSENNPNEIGIYSITPQYIYTNETDIYLKKTIGTGTTIGNGIITISY